MVRRSTDECEQSSAARDHGQRSKSQKMNLNKRVKRTCPETIDDRRAFREAVKWIDRCALRSGWKEHATAIT
jgi:hypothetical protein